MAKTPKLLPEKIEPNGLTEVAVSAIVQRIRQAKIEPTAEPVPFGRDKLMLLVNVRKHGHIPAMYKNLMAVGLQLQGTGTSVHGHRFTPFIIVKEFPDAKP